MNKSQNFSISTLGTKIGATIRDLNLKENLENSEKLNLQKALNDHEVIFIDTNRSQQTNKY